MGRPKGFTREDVLIKAIALFWEKGLSDTTLQDLERVTGVNKSGLYSEFKDKEDIFLESLRYYLDTKGGDIILSSQPKGFRNLFTWPSRFFSAGPSASETLFDGGLRRGLLNQYKAQYAVQGPV